MTTGSDALFEERLSQINERTTEHRARRQLWLTHHWPKDYPKRCVRIGSRHVCRRCAALYPLGFVVAFLAAFGLPLWPASWDPAAIWILCIPATVAFVGEAIGVFRYSPKWQVGAMLITALAFGRGLGYELVDRWSSEFWEPVAVFGGLWFFASLFEHTTRQKVRVTPSTMVGPPLTGSPMTGAGLHETDLSNTGLSEAGLRELLTASADPEPGSPSTVEAD